MAKRQGGGSNYQEGRIARLITDRGFGFISTEGETQYFFHMSACQGETRFDTLTVGDKVKFIQEPDSRGKGPRAGAVEKMG